MTDERTKPTSGTEGGGRTRPNAETRDVERREAAAAHGAPQEPSDEESAAAERADRNPEAERNYQEYLKQAAANEGEGRTP